MTTQIRVVRCRFAVALMLLAGTLGSTALAADTVPVEGDTRDQKVLSTRTFLNAHPDLKHRTEGWVAYEAGDHAQAMQEFKRAALYADKLSQAMVAELLWKGLGVVADRAAAYAWSDIAAERGYPTFVRLREQYWSQLDETDRRRALEVGAALLAEYSDAVARPRMAEFLRKAVRKDRFSSVSLRPPKEIRVPGPTGSMIRIPSHRFYAKHYWDPVQYEAWQDSLWMPPKEGQVDVGDVQQVNAPVQQDAPPED